MQEKKQKKKRCYELNKELSIIPIYELNDLKEIIMHDDIEYDSF